MPNKKKKLKVKWKNVLKLFIILGLFSASIFIIVRISSYLFEGNKAKSSLSNIRKNTSIEFVVDNDSTIIIESVDSKDKFSPYFIYIKQSMINLDFNTLRKNCTDAVAWVQIKNTSINSPVVKNRDASFYKTHTYNKKKNRFGAIYTNSDLEELNNITIIEGNKALLDLRTLYDKKWQDDSSNFLIKFVTNDYTSLWQMVSVYKSKNSIPSTFSSLEEYDTFLSDIIEKSDIDFKTSLNDNDRLIALSSTDGVVLIGKLIKISYY